jgi:eukaryotic-like serine/threonine-protein kinase
LLAKSGLQYDVTKVLDFGLVKTKMTDDMSVMTMDGTATGTPAYLPPEIALGENQVDGRADLYSLGCVAYYLLTGQLVFNESNATALALAHVQKEPVPPSQRTELAIPAELEAIIMKLLSKKPEDRLRSAQELQRQLRLIRPRITAWCEDLAANWWHTNLPETAARIKPIVDEDEQPTSVAVQSPVSMRA